MTSIDQNLIHQEVKPTGQGPAPAAERTAWGNSAPLGLAAFAVTTFMLSMINAKLMPAEITPVVFGVALMYGGAAQLIAGVIQFRTGNTFTGVLFSTFGAFWLSLFAIAEFFLKDVPPVQVGHALGLFLYAFGIFTVWIAIASFRTNVVVVTALAGLAATLFVLGVGNYYGSGLTVETGGYMGLAVAALAAYLSCAELCEAAYKRAVLPLFPLAKH
ncbi:MAG TPA: acetate uptake transporter [Streptosporangiaceae bacterium]|nr:acetate uptake transporter [Streptosporangiaceae bacterium]